MSKSNTKCILIDPPIMAVNISMKKSIKQLLEHFSVYPPIGLAYLAAVLRENGVKVKIIDAKSLNMSHEELAKEVERENPDFVGVTVFTSNLRGALRVCKDTKKLCPSTKILVGGPHIHAQHNEVIRNEFVDFCVRGEGEVTVVELVNAVSNGEDLRKVKGITFKDGNDIIVTPDRPFIKNLDSLPFPARDLLPNHCYKGRLSTGEFVRWTVITATRGCPFKCKFCSVPRFWPFQRRRSVGNVLDEIEHVYKKYKIKFLRFTDEVFVLNKKWVGELCKAMIERGLDNIIWSCDSRADTVSEELLKEMKKANCYQVAYGIEFGNQRILDFCGKKTAIAQIRKAVDMTKKAGIKVHGLFMIGYPTETRETIEDTITLASTLDLDSADFAIVTPFPGTELFEYCKENDLLRTDNWEEYRFHLPERGIIRLRDVTGEELMELLHKAYREFYFRHVRAGLRQEFRDWGLLEEGVATAHRAKLAT